MRTGLPVVLAFLLMAMVAGSRAEAQLPIPSQFQASGSFVAGGTRIDTNDDDIPADLFIISGSSTLLGPLTNQAVVEWTFDKPEACLVLFPGLATVIEGTLVPAGSTVVNRVGSDQPFFGLKSGDLLFGAFTSGTKCISETGVASIDADGIFIGGTGLLLANATGKFKLTATVTPLVSGPVRGVRTNRRSNGPRPSAPKFGSVEVTVEGTLTLPLKP